LPDFAFFFAMMFRRLPDAPNYLIRDHGLSPESSANQGLKTIAHMGDSEFAQEAKPPCVTGDIARSARDMKRKTAPAHIGTGRLYRPGTVRVGGGRTT
jgi:hypothetical protein